MDRRRGKDSRGDATEGKPNAKLLQSVKQFHAQEEVRQTQQGSLAWVHHA